ncbi:MAG: hypothetical protein IT462_06190 [Planctomycetes bacterium]|nr:hypothetical protein [Planctomycetota bacterium]
MVRLFLLLVLLASPLAAAKLQLKAEAKAADTHVVKLEAGQVTIKRGTKESTHKIDDFVPESAYEIKKQFTVREARALVELARFAMHRELFEQTRLNLADALALDKALSDDVQKTTALLNTLQAESMFYQGTEILDRAKAQGDIDKARALLKQVIEKFPDAGAAVKAEIVLGTLDQVALDLKARQLEEEARKAQVAADEEIRKRRVPVDEWLTQQDTTLQGWETATLEKIEKSANGGGIADAVEEYQALANKAQKLRDSMAHNRDQLIYSGQPARAADLEKRAKVLQVECYNRLAKWLMALRNWAAASRACEAGLAIDPRDARLIAQKVDIDEWYDKDAKPPKDG